MEPEETKSITELENARNLALQKYGRNVYNFALLESWLKVLVSHAEISGHMSEIPDVLSRQKESVYKKTMGQILNQYIEKIDPNIVSAYKEPVLIKEPYFSHKFSLEIGESEFQDKKLILEAISKDRNDLIHHFHERFNFDSIQNCQNAVKFLDLQREECLPYFDDIRNQLITYAECLKITAEFMSSEEFLKAVITDI